MPGIGRGHDWSDVADILAVHAEANPDGTAVIVDAAGGATPSATSFGVLNATVNRFAHALGSLGVARGERMVWCGPNSLEVLVVLHAAMSRVRCKQSA